MFNRVWFVEQKFKPSCYLRGWQSQHQSVLWLWSHCCVTKSDLDVKPTGLRVWFVEQTLKPSCCFRLELIKLVRFRVMNLVTRVWYSGPTWLFNEPNQQATVAVFTSHKQSFIYFNNSWMNVPIKLNWLFLACLSSLFQHLRVRQRQEPTSSGAPLLCILSV